MNRTLRLTLIAALLVLSTVFLTTRPGAATITIRADQTFQTMAGWEATSDLDQNPANPRWSAVADKALDLAADIGINRIRIEVRAGAESRTGVISRYIAGEEGVEQFSAARYVAQNDNEDPFVIDTSGFDFSELDWHMKGVVLPMKQRLEAKGERLWVNLCYVSFSPVRSFQMAPEEYAELMLAVFQHLRDTFGLVPDSVELILEPDNSKQGWNGTNIGQAMVATANRLQENGFAVPEFVAPSVMDMANAVTYLNGIIRVPGARPLIKEISYHRYGAKSPRLLKGIADAAAGLGIRSSMTELWFGAATYQVLMQDLTLANASAFQGRVVHGLYVDPKGTAVQDLRLNEDVRYNAQFYRAIRMGAVRIGAETSDSGSFDPVAFVNPSGKQVVVVAATGAGTVTVEGLAAGAYALSYAIDRRSDTLPDVALVAGAPLAVDMPGKGVLTIEGK